MKQYITPPAAVERGETSDPTLRSITEDKNTLAAKKDTNDHLTLHEPENKTISKNSRSNIETPNSSLNDSLVQPGWEKKIMAKDTKPYNESLNDTTDGNRKIIQDFIVGLNVSTTDSNSAISSALTRPMTARAPPPKAKKVEVVQEPPSM